MRKTRIAGALIAVAAVLLLSGCVRFQAHLTVSPDNTLNGDIVVASVVGDEANAKDAASDRAKAIEQKLLPNLNGADGVTRTKYDQDGYFGSRFTLDNTPLAAINSEGSDGSLQLARDGDKFEFSGKVDFTPDSNKAPAKDADKSDIEVAITFPGTVTDHNGKLDGTRVSWNTSYDGSLDMHATASPEPIGPPVWVWIVSGLGVLAVLAVILITVVVSKRRSTGSTTPPITG